MLRPNNITYSAISLVKKIGRHFDQKKYINFYFRWIIKETLVFQNSMKNYKENNKHNNLTLSIKNYDTKEIYFAYF